MANLNGFDANNVDPASDFEPIPAGKYLVTITNTEMKPTRSGNGHYLELTFQVLDGQYKGRLLWSRLNLDNPNAQAVQIAQGELSAICRAVGVMRPKDSIEMHNLPLLVTVKCKKRQDNGDIVNEIRGYAKKEAGEAAPQQEASNTPPWSRQ
jgi:hypothetical protein